MPKLEITTISSRGQIVIPQDIRKKLCIEDGEKFLVIGEDDTIILKKLEAPSFRGFDELLKRTREFSKKVGLKESDVEEAVKKVTEK